MKSIFDVFNDFYGKSHPFIKEPVHNPVFSKSKLRKDLGTAEKMIIFRFFYNLRNPTDISKSDNLIF